ncbi:MAG: acyl-CoA carboxylase subunit beta [Deltaproteobacteria bacterium]|nr:acyl-CoA carboxylase subunit beta [Deltaproteobacteria bacterium]
MHPLSSRLDVSGPEFAANAKAMESYVGRVRAVLDKQAATEEKYRPRAEKKGKLLPGERLARLLDPGAPFVELCALAGYGMYDDGDGRYSGGKLIAGIGRVSGRRVVVIVWNYAIKGGTIDRVNVAKMLRLQDVALRQRLPIVSLHESGGGNLVSASAMADPWMARLFTDAGLSYGQQAELSAAGIPQITVSHGNATAGGAYQVALSDSVILVREKTQLFLAGPPLLEAGTGEKATAEDLGGALMHATVSGTGEYLAEDDADAIRIARQVVSQLPPDPQVTPRQPSAEPAYSPEQLLGAFPQDRKVPVDTREIIARVVDGSGFEEFNPMMDAGTVCGTAYLGGHLVGIIGNNGPITPAGANKACLFISMCEQWDAPLIFLQNTTGFLVGTDVERRGQVKHSAKLIQHVANTRLPKLTILIGNAYGAGNYAMGATALKPAFCLAWPSARQAAMGGPQARKVMKIVTEAAWARKGIEADEAMQAGLDQQGQMIEMGLEMISESMFCSARLMDDGIIDPRDTRRVLLELLATVLEARERSPVQSSFGVQRL